MRHLLSPLLFSQHLLNALGMEGLIWVIMEAQKPTLLPGLLANNGLGAGLAASTPPQEGEAG